MDEIEGSRKAWSHLLETFDSFCHKLQSAELEEEVTGSEVVVRATEDGILLELWAISCPNFDTIVRNWITTGNPNVDPDEDQMRLPKPTALIALKPESRQRSRPWVWRARMNL